MSDDADVPKITDHEKLKCAERELKYRVWVYPRRVAEKKMSAAAAMREIDVMTAIVADYRIKVGQIEPMLL